MYLVTTFVAHYKFFLSVTTKQRIGKKKKIEDLVFNFRRHHHQSSKQKTPNPKRQGWHTTFFSSKRPKQWRGEAPEPSLLSNYDLPRDNTPRIQIRNGESGRRPRWSIAGPRPATHRYRDRGARETRWGERYNFWKSNSGTGRIRTEKKGSKHLN